MVVSLHTDLLFFAFPRSAVMSDLTHGRFTSARPAGDTRALYLKDRNPHEEIRRDLDVAISMLQVGPSTSCVKVVHGI
jgi:hypothetical protein